MSDACNDIQALKNRQSDLKAKMLERRRQLEGLAAQLTSSGGAPSIVPPNLVGGSNSELSTSKALMKPPSTSSTISPIKQFQRETKVASDPEVEKKLLMVLCDISLDIPSDSKVIAEHTSRLMEREVDLPLIEELLRKFANQKLISIRFTENATGLIVNSLDLSKLSDVTKGHTKKRKRDSDDEEDEELVTKQARSSGPESRDIESLLSMQSTKEREEKKLNEEIQALLVTQTAKEQYLVEKFKSRGGPQLQEFCQYGTREECHRTGPDGNMCKRLHFKKIINKHTDESLGDCSFLNTCFHMDTCKETSNLQNCSMVPGSQHLTQGSMQQNTNQDWFYNFENSNHMNNSYGDPKRDMMTGKFYSTLSSSNVGHVTNPGFLPQASNNGLHNTVRPYPIAPRDDPLRNYASSNIPDNSNVSMPPYQSAAIPETGDVSNSSFQQPNMPNSSNGRPYPDLNIARPTSARSYPPMTLPDSATASTSSVPDMTCPLPFPYASIPYSLTAPPPAPTASVVTTMGNCSGLDMVLPVISHSWSLSTETVFPTTMAMSTAPPAKPTKPKKLGGGSSSAAGKKRMRQPEKWKKNLSKTKKIKGEEHLSRTGNVIPAKRVEEVDCSQCTFKCNENFSYDLRQQLFDVFYSLGSNESQKQFVCQNVQETLTKVSGAGRKEGKFENKRKVSRKYFLPDTDNTRKQVCSKFFCGTLAVGKTFISHALRHKQFGCYVGKERRGKPHNKIPDDLLDPARQHIGSMLGVAVRGSKKSVKKKCLEQGLNITKMHEMYKDECASRGIPPVSLSMYRRVFHTEF